MGIQKPTHCLIVANTWNIVIGVFDAERQQVVNQSAGVIIGKCRR